MERNNKVKLSFVIDCMLNVQLNKLNETSKEISLLKHHLINFNKMSPFQKNLVIKDLNEKMKKEEFWDGDFIEMVEDR